MSAIMNRVLEKAKKLHTEEIEKGKQEVIKENNIKKYGENYSVDTIKKQAETIKQWDTDADVSTFLGGAVKDGVITSNDANNIYKEVTGNKNALYSKENVDYVNNAYKVAYNIPIKKEETKEVSPYDEKYKELDHDGVVRAYNDLYAEYAETGDGRLLDELGYLKTKSEETAGREVLSWKSGQAAKRAEEKRNKLKTDAEVMQYVNVYPEAFKVTKEDGVDIYTVDREKLKEYNIPDAQIEKIEKEIRKRNSGVLGMNLHVQDAEKYASMARNSNFIELEQMSSVSSPESNKYDENYKSYVEKGKTLAVTEFGKEWTYTTSSRGNYLKGQKIDAYKAVALVMAERDGYKIPEEILKEGSNKDLIEKYRNTTNDELNAVAYYIAKDKETGGKQAYRYVDLLEDAVMTRHGTKRADETTGFWGNFALTADAGLEQFEQGIERNFDDKYYYPVTSAQVAVAKTTEDLRKEGRNFAAGAMDFGVAAFNMAPSILVSTALSLALSPAVGALGAAGTTAAKVGAKALSYVPKIAGATTMGLSARGNAYAQMVNQGYSKEQADAYGNMVMVSEAALETVLGGISKFGGISPKVAKAISKVDNVLARLAIQYPAAFVGEGAEEGLQAILEPIFKEIALGYDTGEEIDWEQVAYEALLGGIMGGFFESPEIISSNSKMYFNDKATGKKVNLLHNTEALIERAKNDTSNKSNLKKATKIENSNKNTDTKVGALFRHMVEDGQITQAEAQRLVSEGLDGAPLSEGEQAFYYAGANGISALEAARMLSDLNVDSERAIKAWQKGAESKNQKTAKTLKADTSAPSVTTKYARDISKAITETAGATVNPITRKVKPFEVKTEEAPVVQNDGNVVETPAVQNSPVKAVKFKGEAYEQAKTYKTEANAKDFEYAYTQGFNRVKPSEDINLEDSAISAAYLAGVSDSRAVVSSRANFEARTPGLNLVNTVSRNIATNLDDSTRATINNIGKKLGIEIRLTNKTNEIAGGNTKHSRNSSYNFKNGVVTINVDEIHIGLKGRKLKKNELVRFILAHEGTHRLQETSPEAYAEMEKIALSKSNMTLEEYMEKWNISDEAEARGEIVADYFGDLLSTKAEAKALLNENRSLWDKILEVIDWLIYKLKGTGVAYNDIVEARELFRQALKEADATVWGKDVRKSDADVLSRSEEVIAKADVEAVKAIPRKSVNDFTNEELRAVENLAKKVYFEIKEKSPFFRAWFGDWRAGDKNSVEVVDIPKWTGTINSGNVRVKDTGWDVFIGGHGKRNTESHSGAEGRSVAGLANIKGLMENAVLLDTETHEHHSNNRPNEQIYFDHKFYALGKTDRGIELYKITVEEMYQSSRNYDYKRFHNLKEIEVIAKIKKEAETQASLKPAQSRFQTTQIHESTSTYTVADLFEFVKKFDKSFNPKPSSLVVNEDGTPMVVYHGTDSKFTAFDISKGRSNMDIQGAFFSPWELDAKGYGENVGQYFLNIKKPASGEVAFAALNRFKGQNNAGVKAREYLIKQGYDGVDFYGEEYVAFYPTQIKSATDNIGTFDGNDADTLYSKSTDDSDVKYFPPGEKPRRAIDVPSEVGGKKVMRGARTTAEAEGINEDYAFRLVDEIRNGNFTYEVSSNKAVALKATNEVNENYDKAKAKWDGIIMSGKRVTPEDIALGEALLVEASHRRNVEETLKINAEVAMLATEAGQVVQAMRILKRLSPDGQLRYLEVVTDRINAERQKTKGKKYNRLVESENEVAKANKKYQEADKKVKDLEKKGEEILNTINQLQNELESEDRIANLEEQEKALKKEVAMLKKELAKESDSLGKEKIREQIKLLEEDIKENASQLKDALDEKSRLVSERNAMGKELTAIKNAKKATDNAVEKLAGDMALLENEIADLDSQLEKATKFKKKLEEELSRLRKERRTIKDKIKRREDSSEKAFAEIEPLENEITELKEKLEIANTALNEVTEKRNALREERNKLRGKLKRREGAIERETTRTKEITNQIEQLLDDLYNADIALEQAKANRKAVDEKRQKVNELARYAQSKAGKVVLPDDLKAKILQAQNEDELKAAMEIATDYIAANVKTTWAEKIRAWRYLAMLGNLRTIFRNFAGNVFMNIPVAAKNVFAYPMEAAFVPINNAIVRAKANKMAEKGISQETIDSYLDRSIAYKTQTLKVFKKRSEDIKKFVKESWDTNLKVAMEGGKYDSTSMADEIESKRVIFKNKGIEAWRKVTNWAMESGDLVFVQFNYKQALTRFMLANNLNPETITQAERARAEAYAIKEAQEATFRDKSKLAESLNTIKKTNWATELLLGGLFPFTKTPINVMKRSFEYSPLGLINTASDFIEAVKGTKNVTDVINSAAKMLSGSALVALGAYLAAQGFLHSTGDDEDEEYDYLAGEQDYAITIGDKRYTIDWASPTAIPLLLGASMYESYFKNDGGVKKKYFIDENGKLQEATAYMNFVDSLNKAMTLFNPVFEATYLSGFADAIETGSQFSSMPGESIIAFGTSSVLSFGKQFIPTVVGQVARIIDPIERRNNEVDQTSGIPRYAQKGVAKIKNSIPWLRESSTPYVDAWGRIPDVKDEPKDYFWSAVENLISPGFYQEVKEDDTTKELWRLQNTEDGKGKNVFPDAVGNSYTQTKDKIEYTYVFNPEQKNKRQIAESGAYREFAETFLNSDIYSDLTDAERSKVLDMLNSYSEAEGIKAVYKDFETGNSTVQKMYAAEAEGISPEAYALWKVAKDKADKPNKNGNMGTYTNSEKDEAIRILMKQYGIELTPKQRTSLKKNY